MRRALVLSSLLLAACGGTEPARRLVVAYPAGPQSLDPHHALHEEFASSVLANVYEGLVEVQPDLTVRPGLAGSWYSPDDHTWVFVLRDGVRFHDGHVLTASDVVRSFESARQDPWMAGEVEPVESVTARGEREVAFRTRVRLDALPARLTYFFVTRPRTDAAAPAGTGPYRVRSWSPEGPTILERFDGYRGGVPPIPEVEFRVVPEPRERARMVREGTAHLTMDVLPEDRATLAAAPGVRVVARPGLRVVFLGLDTSGTFRDRRLREAVALALDKDRLVAGPLHGLAERTEQLPRPGEVGFVPALPARPHDVARARQLITEAGVTPPGDVALDFPRGKYLAIDGVAAEIARQVAEIGLRVVPRPLAAEDLVRRVETRATPFFLLGWLNDTGSVYETYASLLATSGLGAGVTNGSRWSHPPFDALLAEVAREPANDRRGDLLRQATRVVDAELPVIPLYCQHDVYAFSDDLDFEPSTYRRILVSRLRFRR